MDSKTKTKQKQKQKQKQKNKVLTISTNVFSVDIGDNPIYLNDLYRDKSDYLTKKK